MGSSRAQAGIPPMPPLGVWGEGCADHVENVVLRVLSVKGDAEMKMKRMILEEKKRIYR